jgi:Skp family chaperone for outer membrane proteins
MIIQRNYIGSMLLCMVLGTSINASSSKESDTQQLVRDVGECGGTIVRLVAYDQEAIFGQDERGMHRCFELQDRLESLNREFEKRRTDLRERGRNLKTLYQDQEANANDPQQMAKAMKEQSALDIDAKLAQQEYQTRLGNMQGEFLKEVQAVIQELADEFDWDIVIPVDKKSSYVAPKVDVTEKIIKRLNEKYRAKQRAKKFAESNKKENATAKS